MPAAAPRSPKGPAAGQRLSGRGLHGRTLGLRIPAQAGRTATPGLGSLHPPRNQPSSLYASAIPRGFTQAPQSLLQRGETVSSPVSLFGGATGALYGGRGGRG